MELRRESLKPEIVDSYFEVIKKKVSAREQNAVVFYGEGTLELCGSSERTGVLTGFMKRACKHHFMTR